MNFAISDLKSWFSALVSLANRVLLSLFLSLSLFYSLPYLVGFRLVLQQTVNRVITTMPKMQINEWGLSKEVGMQRARKSWKGLSCDCNRCNGGSHTTTRKVLRDRDCNLFLMLPDNQPPIENISTTASFPLFRWENYPPNETMPRVILRVLIDEGNTSLSFSFT